MSKGNAQRPLTVIKNVLVCILAVLAVAMMIFTVVSVRTFDNNERSLFGYKAFVVLSDSMSSVEGDTSKGYFNAGDLVLSKTVDASSLKPGDIISYRSTNTENYGAAVTHMIRSVTKDQNGDLAFVTYGTATGVDDENLVSFYYVLGKYETHIPLVGRFFLFLKTPPGYIICILLPFLLLIGMQGLQSIRLFRQYKEEQLAELEAQRAKEREAIEEERRQLAEERRRQEELMQQLLKMQQSMSGSGETKPAEEPNGEDKPE